MTIVGLILVVACAPLAVALRLRRRTRATRSLRATLVAALDLTETNRWPDPEIAGTEPLLSNHPATLTGLTSTGHRYWVEVDAFMPRPSAGGYLAMAVELEDGLDPFRITTGGAWTKQRFGDRRDVFAQRFNVTGVSGLDPALKRVLTDSTPAAVDVAGPILTVVVAAATRRFSRTDVDRLIAVSRVIVEALDATLPGLAERAGTIDTQTGAGTQTTATSRLAQFVEPLAYAGIAAGLALVVFA